MPDHDPHVQRLCDELLGLYARRPDPAELAAGLAAMAEHGGPVEVSDPAALAARLPHIPDDFIAGWVERFARDAACRLLPGRLERMADQSREGLALALLEFVQFLDQNATEYHHGLDQFAHGAGLNHTQLSMLLQAGAFAALESYRP